MNSLVIYGFLLYTLASCTPLAERCLQRFPVVTDTVTTERVVTDTFTAHNLVVELVDTTVCPPGLVDTLITVRTVTRQLPPVEIIREYTCVDTVIIDRNAEKINYLSMRLLQSEQARVVLQSKVKGNRWFTIAVAAIGILLLVLHFVRR